MQKVELCRTIQGPQMALAALLGFVLSGALSPAQAEVACGGTIRANATLAADLPCPSGIDPVLTVVGPAQLDLGGFTVACESSDDDGILLEGVGAMLSNGTVADCEHGVTLAGEGGHHVSRVVARENSIGFAVDFDSDGNRILGNRAEGALSSGIAAESDDNDILDNVVTDSGEGIEFDGHRNRVMANEVRRNDLDGIRVAGGDQNTVSANVSADNGRFGIFLDEDSGEGLVQRNQLGSNGLAGISVDADGNTIRANSINDNGGDGIDLDSDAANNLLETNWVTNNAGNGIRTDGDRNTIRANLVRDNGADGIHLDFRARDNLIQANRAFRNADDDLVDENLDCDNNTWRANLFDTADPADCID